MGTTIPKAGTLVPSDVSFGIIKASDQVGGKAEFADETAISGIAVARLVIGQTAFSQASGITYQLTSLTPSGSFANGTWVVASTLTSSAWSGVQLVATANLTLSGEQTIDGVLTSSTDVLVVGQSTPKNNGIYTSNAGAWTRRADATSNSDFAIGKTVAVTEGTTNAGSIWVDTVHVIVGTSAVTFVENAQGGSTNWGSPGDLGNVVPKTVTATQLILLGRVSWSGISPSEDGIGISLADANHTLTSSEYSYRVINLLGAMTAKRTLTFPLDLHSPYWLVRNATSGGFPLTIQGGSGNGIDLAPGVTAIVWTDATNYYAISGGGGLTLVSTVQTASFSPTAGNHYKLDTSGGAVTATLPSAPNEGDEIAFTDVTDSFGTNALTIAAAGSGITVQDWARFTKGATTVFNRIGSLRLRYMGGTAKFWAVVG